jgi:polyhydroxyalkanoate synthase
MSGQSAGLVPSSATASSGPLELGRTALALAEPVDEPDAIAEFGEFVDRSVHATLAYGTLGLSPAALVGAYADWAAHLLDSPGKQLFLMRKAMRKGLRYQNFLQRCLQPFAMPAPCIEPLPQDRRFVDPAWQLWPFNAIYQGFLLTQQWWHNATTDMHGVTLAHEKVVAFAARQILDMVSPANFVATNPIVLRQTIAEGGANLVRGMQYLLEDVGRDAAGRRPVGMDGFIVGKTVAATPGKVVYRNRLIELIQYEATTATVHPEPVLIVPAWIMKYYILDLSAQNSLVRFLTGQGFTVFMISWKNPGSDDRDLGMEDYRLSGVMAALDAACAITGASRVHATGYCLGGTLLSIAAATMARDGDDRLQSLSLFAAQQDFTEAGELTLFINESQIAFLEDMMAERGYLDAGQMAGAFQLLRSNDLIWSHLVHDYLMGERTPANDLMAWNADTTRMPARMHSEYLRQLFLDNDLAEGRYLAGGRPIAIADIRAPIFAVGTVSDHVAPWRSVHKIHLLTDAEVTFVLTAGGHNAGIVSEPGHKHRSYRILIRPLEGQYMDPDTWEASAQLSEGSWWPAWASWLRGRSGALATPPPLGNAAVGYHPLCDAPGEYVLAP